MITVTTTSGHTREFETNEAAAKFCHEQHLAAARGVQAPAPEPSAPPAGVPVCKAWCGGENRGDSGCFHEPQYRAQRSSNCFCLPACAEAGRPLNPPPSDPVTVATGGVPAGYRLDWKPAPTDAPVPWACTFEVGDDICGAPAAWSDGEEQGACAGHAFDLGALVPIGAARSVPPGPVPVEHGNDDDKPASPALNRVIKLATKLRREWPQIEGDAMWSIWRAMLDAACLSHYPCPDCGDRPLCEGFCLWSCIESEIDCVPTEPTTPRAAPASEPAVRPKAPRNSTGNTISPMSVQLAAYAKYEASENDKEELMSFATAFAALEAELADEKAAHDMTRDAVKVAVDCENAARAEAEQLRGKLADADHLSTIRGGALQDACAEVEQLRGKLADAEKEAREWQEAAVGNEQTADERVLAAGDQATDRERSMRDAAANVARGWRGGGPMTDEIAAAIRALPAKGER